MSVQVEKLEKNMAKLTIEVPGEDFEKAIEREYNREKGRINIPGFRKGKAPRKVIEKMYGPEVFFDGAINDIIPDAYEKAYDESGEDIVSSPKIEVVQAEAGKPVIFTATVALRPPVKLGKYKGVEVEAADVTVTDEDVDAELKLQQNRQARMVEVTDRAVKGGDQVTLDFEGFQDGTPFEGGKGTDYPLTIGSGAFIPGFEEQLIGAEIGKETEVKVTFPEDYQEESLAGKPAVFKCTVKAIKGKELPELDDEFASEISEFDTLAEYRESVKADLEERKLSEAKEKKQDEVIEKIVEASEMEIQDEYLETEQRGMLREYAQQLRMQGMTLDNYYQYTGLTEAKLLDQMKPQALARIQSRLVLGEIAKKEKIEPTDEDLAKELETMAEAYQMEVDKVKEMLGEDGEKNVREDLVLKKAMEFVTDKAKEMKEKKK